MTGVESLAVHDTRSLHCDEAALVARVLAPVIGEAAAARTSGRLLERFGSVDGCVGAGEPEMRRVLGDEADLCLPFLVDLRALLLATLRARAVARPIIGGKTALKQYLRAAIGHERREQMRVLFLDHRNGLIAEEVTGAGTLDHAPVYPREIVRRALELGAAGVILVHNHPSGDPRPSEEDVRMTDQVIASCEVFGIEVHDHVVIGRAAVFSFHANAMIRRVKPLSENSRGQNPTRRKKARVVHESLA